MIVRGWYTGWGGEVKLYYEDNQLIGEFQQGLKNWKVKYPSPHRGRYEQNDIEKENA